jgi:NNMT/PNMT/TEMT family
LASPDVTVCAGRRALNRAKQGPGTRRWAVTLVATAASTYALDAVATAAGVLLAASAFLAGADHGLVLAFLAGTYVVWGAGLRANLRANWTLLETTGTSTNALSKAAHDLLRTRSLRVRRFASAVGYVSAELAKEVPYYAGAFGAAVLSDSVSSNEALVFLGGANLGAAAYEYGLAGVTRTFLRRRSTPHASFDTDWVPKEYLADYYSSVEPDELDTIAFFVDAMRHASPGEPVLYFGTGPTLHHVFLAAGRASEIHLGDYLRENLREIERWLERDPDAHDWRPFVRYTLECEGLAAPTDAEVTQREELTRAKVTRLVEVDARHAAPLSERYGTVVSAYCADSATADRATWETYMHHIAGLVRPGGTFITAALRRSQGYLVGGKSFPSANIDEDDLHAVLEPSFDRRTVEVRELAAQESHGYSGIVLAVAQRQAAAAAAQVA